MMERYSSGAAFDRALAALWDHWSRLLDGYQVSFGDEKLDRMVNIWNQYQCMVTFNLSRSASYYESGMGFRDSNQDLLGFVHMIPGRARSRILDIAATQLPDGSAWHQYQPLTKKGNADIGGGFNDDPLWLVAGVFAYLSETGDDSILCEPTQFDNQEGSEQPLLEHLRRSVRFTMTHRGSHGLPLIGRADWNDCLNLNCFSSTPGRASRPSKTTTPASPNPCSSPVCSCYMASSMRRSSNGSARHAAWLRPMCSPKPRLCARRSAKCVRPRSPPAGTARGSAARTTPTAIRSAPMKTAKARSTSSRRACALSLIHI